MNRRLYSYILKTYFRKKREALFGILGVAICAAGLIGGGLLISNYIQLNVAQKKDLYGTQSAILLNPSDEETGRLQTDPAVQKIGAVSVFASGMIPNSVLQNKIYFGCMDRNAAEQASLRTISGRMPEKAGEIAFEKATIIRLGIENPIGAQITLSAIELNPISDPAERRYTFTIVGVVKNYSELQGNSSSSLTDASALPNAFLSPDHPICKNGIAVTHLYLNAAPGEALEKATSSGSERLIFNESVYPQNTFQLLLSENPIVNLIFFALILFLFLICILGLYTNTKAGRASREETVMKLKCLGAGNRYFLFHFFVQNSLCLLLALPAGLILGLLSSRYLFQRIVSALQFSAPFHYHLSVILPALIGAALLFYLWSMLSVRQELQQRPMTMVSNGSQQGGSRLPILKRFPLFSWGLKSTFYHSNTTANIILSFSLCFIALLSGVTLTRVLQDSVRMTTVDYSVSLADGNYYTLAQIQYDPFQGMDSRDLQRFERNSEAKHTWQFSSFPVKLLLKNNVPGNAAFKDLRTSSLQESGAFEPETLRKDLAAYRYTMEDTLYPEYINGLDDGTLEALKPYLEAGTIDVGALKTGKQIILLSNGTVPNPFHVGEQLHFTQVIRGNRSNPEDLSAQRIDFPVTVGAILKIEDSKSPYYEMLGQNAFSFLWHQDAFAAHQLPVKTNYLYIELEDPALYERTELLLEELKTLYPDSMIYAQPQNAEAAQKQMEGITWACTLAVILISLLGLFQMINTVFLKMKRQTRVWGMLRASGIEKRQAVCYQIFELMSIILIAWMLGNLLSVIICYGLYYGSGIQVMQFFPWGLSAAALAVIFGLCIPIGTVSVSAMYRKNIVSLLTRPDFM